VIYTIVLAAGESRRMGTQKLLLPFGSTNVIAYVVDQLIRSGGDKTLVVVRHEADKVVKALSGQAVTIVENLDYVSGMLSSARCGLRALPPQGQAGLDGVLVALGDQPAITTELVDYLIQAFIGNSKGIVVPVFGGRRGHPLLFAAHYRDEILTHYGDVGLRGLLHAHTDDVLELTAPTAAVLSDMDYPEDYRRELAALEERNAAPGT
jgi:molybdenum cofactor cytidylyltransferase